MRALIWIAAYAATWLFILAWFGSPAWLMLLLYPVACPAFYYAATPVAARLRLWRYLSAYLILHRKSRRGPLALHLGTSYDLVWRLLPRRKPGERVLRALHREIYRGLAEFCSEVQSGKIPPATVVTTCSYFLTAPQMTRLGFTESPAPAAIRLNFLLAYPEILFQQGLISGRLRLYKPAQVRFFHTTAAELVKREALFRRLAARERQ